jgi:hypothetical protein
MSITGHATRAGKRSRCVEVLLCERSHTLCVASYYTIGQPAQAIATTIQFYLVTYSHINHKLSPLMWASLQPDEGYAKFPLWYCHP